MPTITRTVNEFIEIPSTWFHELLYTTFDTYISRFICGCHNGRYKPQQFVFKAGMYGLAYFDTDKTGYYFCHSS